MAHHIENSRSSLVVTEDMKRVPVTGGATEKIDNTIVPDQKHQSDKVSNAKRILTSLTAGAIAGALAKTTIAPLDRAKINFQISNRPYSAREAVRFLTDSVRSDGFPSLWRGNSATMARIVPYAAIQFCAFEQWRRLLGIQKMEKGDMTTSIRRFFAGSLAGITSQSLTYPLDMARARMAVTHKETYSSLSQVFIRIWKEEGPRTLFRGYWATLLGVIPYAGTSFLTYETMKYSLMDWAEKTSLNPVDRLICGAVAGLFGQSASYPLDIVRRRMQTAPFTGNNYSTILGTIQKIYSEEGIRHGLYKGLSMNWVKGPIAVGISFSTFETIHLYLLKQN